MEIMHNKISNDSVRNPSTIICFSHLRWDFVYQRPQHLLSRFAKTYTVYFFEEPVFDDIKEPVLSIINKEENVCVVKPHIPNNTNSDINKIQKNLLDKFLNNKKTDDLLLWYYTPMALLFSAHLKPAMVVYDCMDELSHFKFAPAEILTLENELFKKADVVFTGGQSLYEHKKNRHNNIFALPSSIDKKHFERARNISEEPLDQAAIKGPKLGFYGVLDERFDIDLLNNMALLRPDWNFILLGPIAKIDPASLPKMPNIYLLGGKSYQQLPEYLAGWDVALIPFAINDSTRFISPTKTPEYLAAGVPVVSTAIQDVINPYGKEGLVKISSTAAEFVDAANEYLNMDQKEWQKNVDDFLADKSWDNTFISMLKKIDETYINKISRRKRSGLPVSKVKYEEPVKATSHTLTEDHMLGMIRQSATG